MVFLCVSASLRQNSVSWPSPSPPPRTPSSRPCATNWRAPARSRSPASTAPTSSSTRSKTAKPSPPPPAAGGLVSTRRERFRAPEIRVRVGDYKFDNTNYVGSGYPFGPRYNDRFPLDDLYPAIRRFLWLETDSAYKSALETFSRKRAALRNVAVNGELNDFAHAEPVKLLQPTGREAVDEPAWLARVRVALRAARRHPRSSIRASSSNPSQTRHYYVNSEGAEVRVPESVVFLRARALAQAPDGMTVRDADVFHAAALLAACRRRRSSRAASPR